MLNLQNPAEREAAKAWTQRTLDNLRDGGVWAIPRSATMVRVDHTTKTVHVTHGNPAERAVVELIRELGYEVKEN